MPRPSAKVTDMLPYAQSLSQPKNAFHVQVWLNKTREVSPWNGSGGLLLVSERRVLSSISEQSKWICGGQSSIGTGFTPSTSVSHQSHYTNTPYFFHLSLVIIVSATDIINK
jgi:hypothetical protein